MVSWQGDTGNGVGNADILLDTWEPKAHLYQCESMIKDWEGVRRARREAKTKKDAAKAEQRTKIN